MRKNRSWFVDVILIILAIFVCFMMIMIFRTLNGEGKDCLSNGFIYGANNQVKGGGLVQCSCTQTTDKGIFLFEFNNTNWKAIPVEKPAYDFRISQWEEE